ncbi:MAG: 4Fe-4S dicluster domain-containing protein [Desulfovibrionaceae bacterium]|nr:4Fe-4S dicluster domain-containing protein [Desulfovibrionaceae bacterium]
MSRPVFAEERCKGCMLCASVCPQKILAISSRYNPQGYLVAEVSGDKPCTACASCALICPDCAISIVRSRKEGK